jgi:hypothetical protein
MATLQTAHLPHELNLTAHNRDERFAAAFLGTATETLRTWRRRGIGPPWRKINGKLIRYSLAELIAWVNSQPGVREDVRAANPDQRVAEAGVPA